MLGTPGCGAGALVRGGRPSAAPAALSRGQAAARCALQKSLECPLPAAPPGWALGWARAAGPAQPGSARAAARAEPNLGRAGPCVPPHLDEELDLGLLGHAGWWLSAEWWLWRECPRRSHGPSQPTFLPGVHPLPPTPGPTAQRGTPCRGALPWGPATAAAASPRLARAAATWAPGLRPTARPGRCQALGMAPCCVLPLRPHQGSVNPLPSPCPAPSIPAAASSYYFLFKRIIIFPFHCGFLFLLLAMYRLLQGIPSLRGAPCPGWCVAPARCPRPRAKDVRREARREAGPNSTKQTVLRQRPPLPPVMLSCTHPAATPWCPQPRAGTHPGWVGNKAIATGHQELWGMGTVARQRRCRGQLCWGVALCPGCS